MQVGDSWKGCLALGKQGVPSEGDRRVMFVFGGVALRRISRNFHNI